MILTGANDAQIIRRETHNMEKRHYLGSSLVAVILSLGTIIVGKLWLSLNTTIVLLLSATVVSCFVVLKGVKWSDIETEISRASRHGNSHCRPA